MCDLVTDFVTDEQPSKYLKLTMSRRIKDKTIAEDKLVPFLLQLLQSESNSDFSSSDAQSVVKRVLYGSGSRRAVLLELSDVVVAQQLREMLHEKPCELLGRRPMYVEFALPRKELEARDRLLRVQNVQRTANPPSLRVPGLRFNSDFITAEEEAACVAFFERENGAHWANTIRARQVQHFGYEFNYDTRRCDPEQPIKEPIPEVLQPILHKIAQSGVMDGEMPDQITVNEYLPGQGIAFHVDTHSAFTTTIGTLSICSEVVMDFRHLDGVRSEGVLLPARSLAVMSGASRYTWEHAIVPRVFDVIDGKQVNRQRRISITFRKIRSGPCECPFPKFCDTPGYKGDRKADDEQVEESRSLAPTALEQQYVHEFYETVAAHFSSTRHSPWPRVAQFVGSLPSGSMVADLGCGNGKYMKCVNAAESFVVGGDRSSRLVNICRDRGLEAMVCDAMAVPLRSNSCDAALSIAVLHHLSTLGHRLAAVKELLRVLRVGGRGIIYAWAHEQMKGSRRRFEEGRQDFMVPWNLDKRFAFSNENGETTESGQDVDKTEVGQLDLGEDVSEDTSTDNSMTKVQERVVVQRYCHMFKQGELESLVQLAGNAEVDESYYDESNWAVILRRVS